MQDFNTVDDIDAPPLRFLLVGPAKSLPQLTDMLNEVNEGVTRITYIYAEGAWLWKKYWAVLDRALQMVVTPDDYLTNPFEEEDSDYNSDFRPGWEVKMA